MEEWEVALDGAENNVKSSHLLYDNGMYGHSAYHIQQALELSIKAGAYKLGFLRYLNCKPPLYDHNPTEIILPVVYDYLTDQVTQVIESETDEQIKSGLTKTMRIFKLLSKTLYESRNRKIMNENIWKISLKIKVEDKEIEELKKNLDEYRNMTLPKFLEHAMKFSRSFLHEIIKLAGKMHLKHKIHFAIRDVEKQLTEKGIPASLVKSLLGNNEENWKRELFQFVQRNGEFATLDMLFGPNGLLTMLENNSLNLPIQKKWDVKDRVKIMSTMYIATLSPLSLLIYPHEVLGRYPESRPDFDTEKIYSECKNELKEMIDECDLAYQRIRKMLKPN